MKAETGRRLPGVRHTMGALIVMLGSAAAGCSLEVPDDPACVALRDAGLSSPKVEFVREWIRDALSNPRWFEKSGKRDGPLWAGDMPEATPVWDMLGIAPDEGMVEFHGPGVDYRRIDSTAVEAVVIGRGYGYKLVFRVHPETDIEAQLKKESEKPYGDIRIRTLGPDIVLVCQVNL